MMRGQQGFTLLETTFVVAIFTVIMGITFTMAISFGDSAQVQNLQANSNDAARRFMLMIVPDLRQASRSSINWGQLPGSTLTYRPAEDVDGNGTAVDKTGRIELGSVVTVSLDTTDANQDGLKGEQAIRSGGGTTDVLCSNLAASTEITNPDGTTSKVSGLWFRPWGNGLEVILTTEGRDRRGRPYQNTFTQIIMPRN